jgi:hypothetical protein
MEAENWIEWKAVSQYLYLPSRDRQNLLVESLQLSVYLRNCLLKYIFGWGPCHIL